MMNEPTPAVQDESFVPVPSLAAKSQYRTYAGSPSTSCRRRNLSHGHRPAISHLNWAGVM